MLALDISRAIIGEGGNFVKETYPSDKQYLATRETKEGREYLNTFARRRAGAGSLGNSWLVSLFVIRIKKGRRRKLKEIRYFSIKGQFYTTQKFIFEFCRFARFVECKKGEANSIFSVVLNLGDQEQAVTGRISRRSIRGIPTNGVVSECDTRSRREMNRKIARCR